VEALEQLGWSSEWAAALHEIDPGDTLAPARVVSEQRGALQLSWSGGQLVGDVSGRLRWIATGAEELPGVGDWVAVAVRPEEGRATVHHVLPRRSALIRKAPERPTEGQLLAANVDTVLVVASAGAPLRPRRIERSLALAREGGADAVVVLGKCDLAADMAAQHAAALEAAGSHAVVGVSALTGEGLGALAPYLAPRRSLVLIGPSGVGKSTLVNRLAGRELLATQPTRESDDKGRHTTTHRELVPLPGGAVLIDTPGLREVGLWGEGGGVEAVFPELEALAARCRFADCGHGSEPGCAVRSAVEDGSLPIERLESQAKLEREARRLESRRDARARHERRKERKRFSKMVRNLPDKRRPD